MLFPVWEYSGSITEVSFTESSSVWQQLLPINGPLKEISCVVFWCEYLLIKSILAQTILSQCSLFKTLLCSLGTSPDPTLDQTIHVVQYNVSMAEALKSPK